MPDAVVGHSLGEVAAAHVAGALGLDEAIRVVFHRGRLMQRRPASGSRPPSGSLPTMRGGWWPSDPRRLSLAAVNGPNATTISGDPEAVREAVRSLQERDVFARLLDVAIAFHGPQMDPVRRDLVEALAGLRPSPGRDPPRLDRDRPPRRRPGPRRRVLGPERPRDRALRATRSRR